MGWPFPSSQAPKMEPGLVLIVGTDDHRCVSMAFLVNLFKFVF